MPGEDAYALLNLGNALASRGRSAEAIDAYTRAIQMKPDFVTAHLHLGTALGKSGQMQKAVQSLRRALELEPKNVDVMNNLGIALYSIGQPAEAAQLYRRILTIDPRHFLAHNNLAAGLLQTGEFDQAAEFARTALAMRPDYPPAHRNLGDALASLGNWSAAAESYRRLLELVDAAANADAGAKADARTKLGLALGHLGRIEEAIAHHRDAITLTPNAIDPLDQLAHLYWHCGRMDEASDLCAQTVRLHPHSSKALNNSGLVLLECGELDDAIAAFERAFELDPSDRMSVSNKILTILFHPAYDTAAILRETSRWQERLGPKTVADDHRNDRSIDRRLRIGYVSPHLRDHVVGRNIAPLFQHRDRGQFEVFCYSNGCPPDRFNRRFRELADEWREIGTSTDDDAAAQIRQDEIDILVDTSLHLAGNRLPIFARKPAPVQVTCFGYPGTTGLKAIDYRLTDPYLDPFGACDDAYTEASIRLAHSFWCYDPQAMDVANCPEPGPLPALAAGRITFGCLNNFRKINDAVVQLWARVLGRVPSSRILALAPRGRHRARLAKRFGELGVAAERVDFIDRESHKRYLESYRRLDIALDTFPYNGHTTSLDAYWMGVPVVTRIGATVVARAGYSQTCNLGLSELAAETDDQFVAIASSLAADLPRLSEIRSSLRSRMRASPLCDAAGWTRGIESAYREIWKDWCVRKGGK